MNILTIVLSLFIFLETLNVILLYYFPTSKRGNGVGVFNAYEKSKQIPEVHRLVRYLINWVAGTKVIFIFLLVIILITGDSTTIFYSTITLIFSISTFFWNLFPILKQMDADNQLSPNGYSKKLAYMILGFVLIFTLALLIYYNIYNT